MKELVRIEESGPKTITFPNLKSLALKQLPKLLHVCDGENVIELPHLKILKLEGLTNFTSIYVSNKQAASSESSAIQPFLNNEVHIPILEILFLERMKRLKVAWSGEYSVVNPMSLLHNLKELMVKRCDSIEIVFNVECDHEILEEGEGSSSSLERMQVFGSRSLRQVWRIKSKGVDVVNNNDLPIIHGFEAVTSIMILYCERFGNIFTPTTVNIHLPALTDLKIQNCASFLSDKEEEAGDDIQVVDEYDDGFLFIPTNCFPKLQSLRLHRYKARDAVFGIETSTCDTDSGITAPLPPNLKPLHLQDFKDTKHAIDNVD